MAKETTPLMQQYLSMKRNYPEYVLLFQMGDFYETFYEDAKTVAQALDIVLTSREKVHKTPMAGFPIKAIDDYLPKLIKAGYKIAIADQIGDPAQAVGIVERKVTQLITPGTVVLDNALDQRRNNYLAALSLRGIRKGVILNVGIAFADASTGEFRVGELANLTFEQLCEVLTTLQPAEILIPDQGDFSALNSFRLQPVPAKYFQYDSQFKRLTEHFQVPHLDGFGVQEYKLGLLAAGVILQYLQEQQTTPRHVIQLRPWQPDQHLIIDSVTNHNLAITYGASSLYKTLDYCQSALGHRLLYSWLLRPSLDLKEITARHDAVGLLLQHPTIVDLLRDHLQSIGDVERLTARLGVGDISPRHIQALLGALQGYREVRTSLGGLTAQLPFLTITSEQEHALQLLQQTIADALLESPSNDIHSGGIFRPEYHPDIATLRSLTADRNKTLEQIVTNEKSTHGISTIKIGYNRIFGYYLEIPHTHRDKVPSHYIRKQTLVNAERYITEELKHLEEEILQAEGKLSALEFTLYQDFIEKLQPSIPLLQMIAHHIGQLDVLTTFAYLAQERQYTRPTMLPAKEQVLSIKQGRHPVVEQSITADFIPNDTLLNGSDQNLLILTGPNMAGKSTYIRQVALITVMAHSGCFVPAQEATISLVDRIFARVGAGDDITTGRSTFMVEMSEAANIIHNATAHSLVILDELGRGTSTYDGLSLAWAICVYIRKHIQAKTILATHYHEITTLADADAGIQNFTTSVAEENDTVHFLRTIKPGKADKSYGIYVAQLVGLPKEIISEAKDILHHLEKNQGRITFIKQPSLFEGSSKIQDTSSKNQVPSSTEAQKVNTRLEEIKTILKDIDLNNTTPMQALSLLTKIKKRLKE